MAIPIFVFVILLCAIGLWQWRKVELAKFRKDVQVGYYVTFRHKGVLLTGVIVACDNESVVINSKYGSHKRSRQEIWFA